MKCNKCKNKCEDCGVEINPNWWEQDFLKNPGVVGSTTGCLHKSCSSCKGTGRKSNGELCVHMISCSCPSCSPTCKIN